ncbi:PstS family phosphate ABC transporter substrate-binding protein [Kiritimatiella glycovorans]|nr:PstS family phosphate ABC transporter substrate-binding protein [Kiritimatiella glycovorans]
MTRKTMLAVAVLTSAMFACGQDTEKVVIDGSSTVGPIAKAFATYFMAANPDINVTVSESGSGNGAKSMVAGNCDIADMSRAMKPVEFKHAVENDVLPVPHVVALDGIALVTHLSNPVQELSMEQIRDIYLGRIRNWSELGGPARPIVVITRDTNSGTFESFEKLVMGDKKIMSGAEVVGSNGQMRSRVESTPAAIGYVGLGFVEGVRALTIDGVEPTPRAIKTGDYPVARPLFMYTDGYPELGSALYRFVTIYLSSEGQEIVEDLGFVPVTSY